MARLEPNLDSFGAALWRRPPRRVVLNADDFGLSAQVNAGVSRAHREGVLTSASLMVGAPAACEAARAAKEMPALDVGLHLVVCRGRSVLSPARLGRIVDAEWRFADNPVAAGLRYFFDRRLRAGLASECRAQVERHLELVGHLHHIDGHLNFHLHPVLFEIVTALAVEYGVPYVRLSAEPLGTTLSLTRDRLAGTLVEAAVFKALCRRARRVLIRRDLGFVDRLFGLHQTGRLSEDYLVGLLGRLAAGVTEIYFHPALATGGVGVPAEAAREVAILTSPRVRTALAQGGIELVTFRDLARERAAQAAADGVTGREASSPGERAPH